MTNLKIIIEIKKEFKKLTIRYIYLLAETVINQLEALSKRVETNNKEEKITMRIRQESTH